MFRFAILPTLITVGLSLGACGPADTTKQGRAKSAPVPGESGTSREIRTAYHFTHNRTHAHVKVGGAVVIDAGTPDLAKYLAVWSDPAEPISIMDQGVRAIAVGRHLRLVVPIIDHSALPSFGSVPLVIRMKGAAPKQVVSVLVNETRVGDLRVSNTAMVNYTMNVPVSRLVAGENRVRLFFRHAPEIQGRARAAIVAGVAVGGAWPDAPPLTVRGDDLKVGRATTLSYYLRIPDAGAQPALHVECEGDGEIHAFTDAGEHRVLWRSGDGPMSLLDLSGSVARLEFRANTAVTWMAPRIAVADDPAPEPPPIASARNIILWSVSSLRGDSLGDASPAMTSLARASLDFRDVWTTRPSPSAANAALITGLHHRRGHVREQAKTLAEYLSERGFMTALISGNGFVRDDLGFARGTAHYQNPMRLRRPHSSRVLWQLARKHLLGNRDRRTFVHIAASEPHLPYTPRPASLEQMWPRPPLFKPYESAAHAKRWNAGQGRPSSADRDFSRALYRAEVRDADNGFAAMLSDLERHGLRDSTAVVLVGDHGQELLEHGALGRSGELTEEALRVPLVVSVPGLEGARRSEPVSLVDVVPTILAVAGAPIPVHLDGINLLAPPRFDMPRVRVATEAGRAAVSVGRYKLVARSTGAALGAVLFDRRSDPDETVDLWRRSPIAARYVASTLATALRYAEAWSYTRWGQPNNLAAAFGRDHYANTGGPR